MEKGESEFSMQKTLLGFNFDGEAKAVWLKNKKTQ
jgi:hypothetical protein